MKNKLFIVAVFMMSFGVGGIVSTIMDGNLHEPLVFMFYLAFTLPGIILFYNKIMTKRQVEVRSFK